MFIKHFSMLSEILFGLSTAVDISSWLARSFRSEPSWSVNCRSNFKIEKKPNSIYYASIKSLCHKDKWNIYTRNLWGSKRLSTGLLLMEWFSTGPLTGSNTEFGDSCLFFEELVLDWFSFLLLSSKSNWGYKIFLYPNMFRYE